MSALDIVLIVLVLLYALSGYWQGFVVGAFSTLGLLLGGLGGIRLAPLLLGDVASSLWVSVGALLVVLVCATVGQALFQWVGSHLRSRIRWQPVRALDALGGAMLSALAVLVVAWALGVAVSGARLPWVTEQVQRSQVLRSVDQAMPDPARNVLRSFNDLVGSSVFPQYLEPFAPERIARVGPPPPRIASDPDVRRAAGSVLKVRGENRCRQGLEGTGFLYAPDRVMTNAHVVAGVDEPSVVVDDREVPATVVYYDPQVDVAVLAVQPLGRAHLAFDVDGEARDPGAVLGYPWDGPFDVQGARIRAEQRLSSHDIYGRTRVVREVFSVRSTIRPGNSGGPLVSREGEVLGVVFAASVTDGSTGYVLTADQVAGAAAAGLTTSEPVSTGDCA